MFMVLKMCQLCLLLPWSQMCRQGNHPWRSHWIIPQQALMTLPCMIYALSWWETGYQRSFQRNHRQQVEACTRSKQKEFLINNPNTVTIDQSTPLLSFDAFEDNWINTGDRAYHPQPPLPVLTHEEGGGWYHRLFCGYDHGDILS